MLARLSSIKAADQFMHVPHTLFFHVERILIMDRLG